MYNSKQISEKIKEVEILLDNKRKEIDSLQNQIAHLQELKSYLVHDLNMLHFYKPSQGDFWHDMFSPVMIVLDYNKEEQYVVICEDTISEPDDRYSFDLHKAKKIKKEDFDKKVRFYTHPDLKEKLSYKVIPNKCLEEVKIWKEKNDMLTSFKGNI